MAPPASQSCVVRGVNVKWGRVTVALLCTVAVLCWIGGAGEVPAQVRLRKRPAYLPCPPRQN